MSTLLQSLLELTVEVRSASATQEFTDTGVLEACDEQWLKLRKENGQVLYFSVVNVRLVKPTS